MIVQNLITSMAIPAPEKTFSMNGISSSPNYSRITPKSTPIARVYGQHTSIVYEPRVI